MSFCAFDNFNLPLIISDSKDKVIYKNNSARYAVKNIRMSANIRNYLYDKKIELTDTTSTGIKSVINEGSIYNKALLCGFEYEGKHLRMWLFSLYLNDVDNDDIHKASIFKECIDSMIPLLLSCDFSSKSDNPMNVRFNEALFRALRAMTISFGNDPKFRVQRVIDSMCKITKTISDTNGLRLKFDTAFLDPDNFTNISFDNLATLFLHTLITVLKISHRSPMEISFSQFANNLIMSLYFIVDINNDQLRFGNSLKDLFPIYTDNYINLLLLDRLCEFYGYKVQYKLEKRNGKCFMQLEFSTALIQKDFILMERNAAAVQMLFNILSNNFMIKLTELIKTV